MLQLIETPIRKGSAPAKTDAGYKLDERETKLKAILKLIGKRLIETRSGFTAKQVKASSIFARRKPSPVN